MTYLDYFKSYNMCCTVMCIHKPERGVLWKIKVEKVGKLSCF